MDTGMATIQKHAASNRFAALFAGALAGACTTACGSEWQIALAHPPPEVLPSLDQPVHFRFAFSQGPQGNCYAIFCQADLLAFALPALQPPGAMAAPTTDPAAALLALLRSVLTQLTGDLPGRHPALTIEADPCAALPPEAAHWLELKATNAHGAAAAILLHFDPPLLASLASVFAPDAAHPADNPPAQANLGLVMDVELNCTLRFGQRQLSLREILDLASGSVVELDREVDEPVELILDGKVIARGEAVIIDGNYGLRVTQVLHPVAY